jgi:thiol-disulfide isomerase/thioredoxin
MKYMIGLVAMLLPLLSGAQSAPVKTLTIGDTVPDITFQKIINSPDTTAMLSDFKDRYIILDFWAEWCGACISKLPQLDSLQEKYKDRLSIILVNCMRRTKDSEKRIRELFTKNWQQVYHKDFNCLVVADSSTQFRHLFYFKMIPHYVWIDTKGVIQAITSSAEVTEGNIAMMLRGKKISLPVKQDPPPKKLN